MTSPSGDHWYVLRFRLFPASDYASALITRGRGGEQEGRKEQENENCGVLRTIMAAAVDSKLHVSFSSIRVSRQAHRSTTDLCHANEHQRRPISLFCRTEPMDFLAHTKGRHNNARNEILLGNMIVPPAGQETNTHPSTTTTPTKPKKVRPY